MNLKKLIKLYFAGMMLLVSYLSKAMELELNQMLIEAPTLKLQAAWYAVTKKQSLEITGIDELIELGNKIKNIQQASMCPTQEKKLFINFLNDPELTNDKIKEHFPELIKKYLSTWGIEFESKTQLLNAILRYSYNSQITRLAIDTGADVNSEDARSAIMRSISFGEKCIVDVFVKEKPNFNFQGSFSSTPLIEAVQHGFKDIVQMLLDAGADVNFKNTNGDTALVYAALCGTLYKIDRKVIIDKSIIKILLNAGADVNAKNNNGITALMAILNYRQTESNTELIQMLLKAGADGNGKDNSVDVIEQYKLLVTDY